MAPSVNRRTGYSRRAQYTTFLAYVAGVLGVLVGGTVLAGSLASQSSWAWLRSAGSDIVSPLGRAAAGARTLAADGGAVLEGWFTWGAENARLKREVALARVKLVEARATEAENQRLKALLGLSAMEPKPVASGWLIASTATSTRRYATLSAGARAGVRPDMPVRTPLGLVGRVTEVGQFSSRILLLTDSESVVPVRRASDGLPAFATGKGDGTLQLRLLTLGINPLKPGDAFVASGSGGIYWPGTPIAVVSSLTHDGAIARVLSDAATSDAVAVLPAWNPTEDATLPPQPGDVPPSRRPAKAHKDTKPAKPGPSTGKKHP